MKGGAIAGISLIAVLMTWYEWSALRRSPWKTKLAYAVLLLASWLIALLLVHNPNLPGPTQALMKIYKPLAGLLKNNEQQGGHE